VSASKMVPLKCLHNLKVICMFSLVMVMCQSLPLVTNGEKQSAFAFFFDPS